MVKIYTKTGDKGMTSDYKGNRIDKDSCLIRVQGKIDLLQSAIDSLIVMVPSMKTRDMFLESVQENLGVIAGDIAGYPKSKDLEYDLIELEKRIDECKIDLKNFIRFRHYLTIQFNEARVRCRELEIELIAHSKENEVEPSVKKYVNRLSDYFFALAYKYETKK